MLKRIAKLLLVSITVIVAVLYWHRTELRVRWARHVFPAGWAPRGGWPVGDEGHMVATLGKGFEVGDVLLGDGTRVAFWFLSHHESGDLGGALFEFPGGETKFVEGFFCCSVEFSPEQITSRAAFDHTLDEIDGLSP